MALPQKTFNIRLSDELAREFDNLAKAIPGLKKGAILRALLAETLLGKSLEDRVRIVTKQLLALSGEKSPTIFVARTRNTERVRGKYSMPIAIQCPSCSKQATVPDSALGKSVRCKCGSSFVATARNDQVPVNDLGLASSSLTANPVHVATIKPPQQPQPRADWQSVGPDSASSAHSEPVRMEGAPKTHARTAMPKVIGLVILLAIVGVGLLIALFHRSENNVPSNANIPSTPVPIWQDDAKLKEVAHKMY